MKKNHARTFRFLAFAFVMGLLTSVVIPSRVHSQTSAWYGEFTVTIKGKGKLEGEFDGDSDIEWKIDRTYYSNFKMTGGPRRTSDYGMIEAFYNNITKADPFIVQVTIADELKITNKNRVQHDTFENTVTTTKWEQDKSESSGDKRSTYLSIDKKAGNYWIDLYFLPNPIKTKNLKITRTVSKERSDAGFGGKPTSETFAPEVTWKPVDSLGMPRIGKFLFWYGIPGIGTMNEKTPLPKTYPDLIVFDSKDMEPDEPMIEGIPDSQTNLKIRVVCRFSRKPLY